VTHTPPAGPAAGGTNRQADQEIADMSVLQATLDAVRSLATKAAATAEDAYRAAVKDAGSGKAIKPERLIEILEDAGKTVADFEKDAAAVARRIEAKKIASEIPARKAAVAEVKKREAAHNAKVEAFMAEAERVGWELAAELKDAERAEKEAADCAAEVYSGGLSHPSIAPRLRELNRRLDWLNEYLQKTKATRDVEYSYAIAPVTAWPASLGGQDYIAANGLPIEVTKERKERAKQTVAKLDGDIAPVERERADLVAAIAKLEQEANVL
jgi:hypothetical protein